MLHTTITADAFSYCEEGTERFHVVSVEKIKVNYTVKAHIFGVQVQLVEDGLASAVVNK